mmetsp:Transcript_33172/g.78369  ORF Transcript_33172/g.78369 Transcript_33172/m.78369 type:complete len:104 (+) Transcript_33172:1507-1818(+)
MVTKECGKEKIGLLVLRTCEEQPQDTANGRKVDPLTLPRRDSKDCSILFVWQVVHRDNTSHGLLAIETILRPCCEGTGPSRTHSLRTGSLLKPRTQSLTESSL